MPYFSIKTALGDVFIFVSSEKQSKAMGLLAEGDAMREHARDGRD